MRFMKQFTAQAAASAVLAILLATTADAQVSVKKYVTADGKRPGGIFAPGVLVDKTLYISGKGDYRPDEDFPEKTRNCLREVEAVLKMAGLDMRHVVKSFCYLEDPEKYAEFNKIYGEFFPGNPPARTTLGVPFVPGDSRIEITCIAYTDLSEIKQIGAAPAGFPFSPAILAGTTLYCSGKGDQLPGGGHPATFEEQVRQAMKNIGDTLAKAGLDFRNVVLSRVYVNNYDNYGIVNKVYSEFFEFGNEPARETVFVDWIPGGSHIEITCIATTDLSTRKTVRPPSFRYGPDEAAMTASPAVWAGNTLYMSSISGFDPVEGITTVDLERQERQMMLNHAEILKTAGLDFTNIVSGNVYLRNINDYQPFNVIYRDFFKNSVGVRTCLMPNSGWEKNDVRCKASFIAARTREK